MQQKSNFVLFIVICLAILIGWTWMQNQLWPPRPKDKDDDKKAAEKKDKEKKEEARKEEAKKPEPPRQFARFEALPALARKGAIYAGTIAAPVNLAATDVFAAHTSLVGTLVKIAEVKDVQDPVKPKPETYVLGGDGYFLKVVVTNQGAGIRSVTFTEASGFKAADALGRPTDKDLQIVQDDPYLPSYLMYHYGKEDARSPDPQGLKTPPHTTLADAIWKVDGQPTPDEIRLSTTLPEYPDLTITKVYRLGKKDYHIGLTLELTDHRREGDGKAVTFRYQFAGPHGTPLEGVWYSSVHRNAVVGVADARGSLWRELEDANRISLRQGGDRVDRDGDKFIQYAGVSTQYFAALIVLDNEQKNLDRILAWARPTLESAEKKGKVAGIIGDVKDKTKPVIVQLRSDNPNEGVFSFTLLDPARENLRVKELKVGDDAVVNYYETHGKRIATWIRPGTVFQPFSDDLTVRVNSEAIDIEPGTTVTHKFLLYHGPAKVRLLSQFTGDKSVRDDLVERYADKLHLRTLTDYRSAGPFGWFSEKIMWTNLLIACTSLMHWLLNLLRYLVPDYGLTIILLTVVVRGLMYPISRKQAMLSMKMQQLAPDLKKLQEKHKGDSRGRTEAMMELYRKHQVNPLGGCLPLLMQLPVFLGLYFALQESIHFRLSRFLWIPNLAAPDMLIWWGEGIPWISDPDNIGGFFYLGPYLNVLPIIAVVLMLMQQKMLTPPPQDDQQAFQQKIFKYMMVFFGIMFYKVASGLCIYFIASSLWGLAERKLLPKKKPGALTTTTAAVGPPQKGGKTFRTKPRPGDKSEKKPDGAFQKVKNWWADVLKQAKKK
jgi:YidC/Oxa1 family membrane protein insertase